MKTRKRYCWCDRPECGLCKVYASPKYQRALNGVASPRTKVNEDLLIPCPGCKKGTKFKTHTKMSVEDMLKLIDGPKPQQEWPDGWESWDVTIQAHRRLFDLAAMKLPSYPGWFSGRGIVTCAGGPTYFTSVYVMISVLRGVGCNLPIEVWHIGPCEMDPLMTSLLKELGGVTVIDLLSVLDERKITPRIMGGWQSKIWSILHTNFQEVLFLDADQVPVRDPSYLFEHPEYQEKGAVLWPDIPNSLGLDVKRPAWDALGIPEPKKYRPVESGQVLVNKEKVFGELSLALTLNEHSDFLYRSLSSPRKKGVSHIYGDKSTFLLSWTKLGTPYAMPKDAGYAGNDSGGGFLHHDLEGELVFQHRCQPQSKWNFRGNNLKNDLLNWDLCTEALKNLRAKWSGEVWSCKDETEQERKRGEEVSGRMRLVTPETNLRLTLNPNGTVKGGGLTRWTLQDFQGEEVVALSSGAKTIHVLGLDKDKACWQRQNDKVFLHLDLPDGWVYREVFDLVIFHSCVRLNEYRLPEKFSPEDRVIDIGAHFGSFSFTVLERGAKHVWAVEPEPRNVEAFQKNLSSLSEKWTLLPAAAWRSDRPPTAASLSWGTGAEHLAGGKLTLGQGSVMTVRLDDVISLATGGGKYRVRVLKLDAECSEWPCLLTSEKLHLVDEICGEYHMGGMNPIPPGYEIDGVQEFTVGVLEKCLIEQGFRFSHVPSHPGLGNFWAVREKESHSEARINAPERSP